MKPATDKNARWPWLVLLLVTLLACGLRAHGLKYEFLHPDEVIATEVVDRVLGESTLDTNWARTQVPEEFRYNQYNFSSYYLFAAAVEGLVAHIAPEADPADALRLKHLRVLSTVLGTLAVWLTGWLGFRLGGASTGLIAASLATVCTSLLQDSIYARPEAFCTVLILAWLLLSTCRHATKPTWMVLNALLLGVLIATKITFVILLPFPLIVLSATSAGLRPALTCAGYFAALGLGFLVGAPFAAARPGEYLEGVTYLFNQYNGGHGVHGLAHGTLLQRLGYGLDYLRYAIGAPCLVAALAGYTLLLRKRHFSAAIMIGAIVLTLLYFLQTRAFFERNFSHALPAIFILTGLAISACWAALARTHRVAAWLTAAVLLGAVIWPSIQVSERLLRQALPGRAHASQEEAGQQLVRRGFLQANALWHQKTVRSLVQLRCTRLAVRAVDYGDRHFKSFLGTLTGELEVPVLAYAPGAFDNAPVTSTLQTYHSPNIWYLGTAAEPEPCGYQLATLLTPAQEVALPVNTSVSGSAGLGAFHTSVGQPHWPAPLYATWAGADANTGTIEFSTGVLCEPAVLPLVIGPDRGGVSVQIQSAEPGSVTVVTEHLQFPPEQRDWMGLWLKPPPGQCRSYRITAVDQGRDWGQWIGLGAPVASQ